jgi:outer membrane protein assembly factor BamA
LTLHLGGLSRFVAAAVACSFSVAAAQELDETSAPIPTFAELEAAGVIIGDIRIDNQDIFDPTDPRENKALYNLANWLHARTRPDVIRKQLLFKSGEPVSARLIDETERNLRGNNYLYDVAIRPVDLHDGVVDIEVRTRDTWTLVPTANLSRSGGVNRGGIGFRDSNLGGTGMRVAIGRKASSEDFGNTSPTTTDFQLSYPNAFGGHTMLGYTLSRFADGRTDSLAATRPFYELDARWTAGLSGTRDDRTVFSFVDGIATPLYRRREDTASVFGGWSAGLVDRWVHRYSVGLSWLSDNYGLASQAPADTQVPADRTLVAPFLRYEVLEDDFRKVTNRDLIGRTEIVAMGFHSTVQFGRSLPQLGSTQYVSMFSTTVGDGLDLGANGTLLASTSYSGEYGDQHSDRQLTNGTLKYYLVQHGGGVLFASLAADRVRYRDGSQQLLLGGDNGLRGYPAHYQSGDRRVLFTAEQRFYTDWFPFRLFRVGGAVFYDAGRAWSATFDPNPANQRWRNDIGFGIRILSARSSTGTTLHLDFAFPLRRDEGIRSYQFSFMSKTGF